MLIKGYAAIFNVKDNYQDIILPDAIGPIEPRDLLLEHCRANKIGDILTFRVNYQGIFICAKIDNKIMENYIRSKRICGLSIGYKIIKSRVDKIKNTRFLEKITVKEVSVVSYPANYLCRISM